MSETPEPKTETYQVVAKCTNCGHTLKEIGPHGEVVQPLRYNIPKGTLTADGLHPHVCPNCGCKGSLRFNY